MSKACIKCGGLLCEDRARYYQKPLSEMCNDCRKETILEKDAARRRIH